MELLSDDWFSRVSSALGDLEPGPGGSGLVEVVVSGGDMGRIRTHWVIEAGRLVSVHRADETEPDVVIPQSSAAFAELVAGTADPAVSFMRGDLKPDGSSGALLAFLSAMAQPACRKALAG